MNETETTSLDKTVCIVGSGLSGLVCGMRLAKAGFHVSIVEELASPGGLLAYTRIGREYLELLPHHLRKSDKALLALAREMGVEDKIKWYDSTWSGRASHRKVGYFDGGFSCLVSSLMQDITDCGGHILFSTTVAEISELSTADGSKGYRTSCILTNSTRYVIDSRYLIFTGSCRTFVNVSHGLPIPIDLRDIMMNVTYKAGLSVMMVSKKPVSEMFFQHAPDFLPFENIINHTAAFGERGYGGHVFYLTGKCSTTDNLWIESDSSIMTRYFTALRKLYPSIRKSDIKSWRVTKTRYAISEKYPEIDLTNPCENLYICTSGLTRFQTANEPVNHMDPVVQLAGSISAAIIAKAKEAEESFEVEDTGTEITSLAELV
jgi:protoporphyrinogen oxidase